MEGGAIGKRLLCRVSMATAAVANKSNPIQAEKVHKASNRSFPPSFPSGLRVLIADGNKKNLLHLEKIVRGCTYVPITTTSINEAIKKLQAKNRNIDVVLIETKLAQVVAKREQWIRITKTVPVVLMTEKSEKSEVLLAMRCGAVEVIQKPCDTYMIKKIWHHVARMRVKGGNVPKGTDGIPSKSANDTARKLGSEDSSLTDKSTDTNVPEMKLRSIHSIGKDLDSFDTLSADELRELLPEALSDAGHTKDISCDRYQHSTGNQPVWSSVCTPPMGAPSQQQDQHWSQVVTGVPAWGQPVHQPVVLGHSCIDNMVGFSANSEEQAACLAEDSQAICIPGTEEEKKALRAQKGPLGLMLKKSESLLDLVSHSLR